MSFSSKSILFLSCALSLLVAPGCGGSSDMGDPDQGSEDQGPLPCADNSACTNEGEFCSSLGVCTDGAVGRACGDELDCRPDEGPMVCESDVCVAVECLDHTHCPETERCNLEARECEPAVCIGTAVQCISREVAACGSAAGCTETFLCLGEAECSDLTEPLCVNEPGCTWDGVACSGSLEPCPARDENSCGDEVCFLGSLCAGDYLHCVSFSETECEDYEGCALAQ